MAFKAYPIYTVANKNETINGERLNFHLQKIQENVRQTLSPITQRYNLDSELYTGLELTGGYENLIEHGFNKKITSYRILKKSTAHDVYYYTDTTADLSLFLPLVATGDVTIDVEIFA